MVVCLNAKEWTADFFVQDAGIILKIVQHRHDRAVVVARFEGFKTDVTQGDETIFRGIPCSDIFYRKLQFQNLQ